ncbi:MAG: sulfite exporter TauE/SafE family protein [Dermatophilaceae bacterium]
MGLALLLLTGGVGVLIGAVGVGGVLLAPALVAVGGILPNQAAATSTWAFLFTGVVGTLAYARWGSIPWPMVGRLAVGVVPGAVVGARTNAVLPGGAVLVVLGVLALLVGVQQLLVRREQVAVDDQAGQPALSTVRLILIGSAVGFGSALTGTGGPVLLVPVLLTLGVTPLTAVAVSQAVQLPVVIAASATYLNAGLTDTGLGTVLGLAAATGTLIGAALAPRLHPDLLRRAVALACVTAGVLLLLRSV